MSYKTKGEEIFAKLLTERGLPFEYERPYQGKTKNPDFTLTLIEPNIISEVKDFDLNDEDKNIAAEIEEKGRAGWMQNEPYKRIRRGLHEKADQLKEYSDYPTLVILHGNPQNLTVNLSTENIFQAMNADMVTIVETDDSGNETRKDCFDATNAVVGQNRNTHLSAVAVIDSYRPNDRLANDIAKKHQEGGGNALTEEGQHELTKLFDEKRAEGINFELEVPRLRIFHNPSAKMPLNLGVLSSPYDIEIFHDPKERKFKEHQNGEVRDHSLS
jgi:hypothetical protein